MLKLGDQGIKALYVGGQKIAKAYVGGELVYKESAKPSHNLPSDYTELEYIQIGPNETTAFKYSWGSMRKDSTLYIDFDVTAFPASSMGASFYNEAQVLYALSSNTQTMEFRMVCFPSVTKNHIGVQYGSFNSGSIQTIGLKPITSDTSVPQSVKLTVDYPNKLLKNNGVTVGTLDDANLYTGAVSLGTNMSVSSNKGFASASIRIKEMQLSSVGSTSSTYNKHWIPAKNASGYIGFYDIVNNKWLRITVATAGPAV